MATTQNIKARLLAVFDKKIIEEHGFACCLLDNSFANKGRIQDVKMRLRFVRVKMMMRMTKRLRRGKTKTLLIKVKMRLS